MARGGRGGGDRKCRLRRRGRARSPGPSGLPTGPAYAGPVQPAPAAAQPQGLDAGANAIATAKRNLPTGPAYASAAQSAPTPPVKPPVVAALSPTPQATSCRASHRASSGRSRSWRRCRRGVRPGSRPRGRARRRAHASGTSGQSHRDGRPRLKGWTMSRGPRRRTRGPAPRRGLAAAGDHARHRRPAVGALALVEASPAQKDSNDTLLARAAGFTLPCPRCRSRMSARPRRPPGKPPPRRSLTAALLNRRRWRQTISRGVLGGLPFERVQGLQAEIRGLRGSQ